MSASAVSPLEVPRPGCGGHRLFAWSSEAHGPRSARLRLRGELDLDGLGELRAVLPDAGDEIETLVVDLTNLDFIDCAAVGLLARAADRISHRGGTFRLVGARGQVARVLDLAGRPFARGGLDDGR
jgi:anti-anti-sigma factor